MNKVVEKAIWLIFLFSAFDAPLRYFFVMLGVPFAIYLKDLLIVGLFLAVLLDVARTGRINKMLTVLLTLMVYGILVGVLNELSLLQVLFGAKVMLPFLIGFIVVSHFGVGQPLFEKLFRVLTPLILLGLWYELFYTMPWKGMEYEAYGATIETSRSWGTFGLPRLSGFGRASFETAALLYSLVVLYLGRHVRQHAHRSWWQQKYTGLLLASAFAGIVVTTSKAAALTMIILFFCCRAMNLQHNRKQFMKSVLRIVPKVVLYGLFAYSVVPPIIALVSPTLISAGLASDNIFFVALSASFIERVAIVWPQAFDLLSSSYQFALGRGLGGIGSAQMYFETSLYNPADNLVVYMFVDYGIVILGVLLFLVLYKIQTSHLSERYNIHFYFLCITLFGFGATMNVFESGALSITAGFMLALWARDKR